MFEFVKTNPFSIITTKQTSHSLSRINDLMIMRLFHIVQTSISFKYFH